MRKITFIMSWLLAFAGAATVNAQVYAPTQRATTLVEGKQYMLYNTTFNGTEDRTGFIFNNGSSVGHSGTPKQKPATFTTTETKYLWTLETTDTEHKYYLKSVSSDTYTGPAGVTNNTDPRDMYIQPWVTSQCPKANVSSENHDGTVTANTDITYANAVFTICGTSLTSNGQANGDGDCWNGNPNTWAKWASSHPWAFYEVREVVTAEEMAAIDNAKTQANAMMLTLQNTYGLVHSADKYTSNAVQSGEGSLANLIDGDYTTYFHSRWSTAVGEEHYLQVELTDLASDFRFFFKKRHNNNNNRPTEILIQGSTDGENFTDITTISEGLPTSEDVLSYTSATIHSDTPCKYYRFVVKSTNNGALDTTYNNPNEYQGYPFFTFSEFYMLPNENALVNKVLAAYTAAEQLTYLSENAESVITQVSEANTAIENATATVTVNHVIGDEMFFTTTESVLKGNNTFSAGISRRPGLKAEQETQTISVTENMTVTFNYTTDLSTLPFEVSAISNGEFPADTKWYYLTQRGKYTRYNAETGHFENSTSRDLLLYADLFAFAGDPANGFKIYNYATGATKVVGGTVSNNGSVSAVDDSDSEKFILENNEDTGGTFHIVFRKSGTTNGYLNDINGTLGYWTYMGTGNNASNDGGSTFAFVPVEEVAFNEIPLNEAKNTVTQAVAKASTYTGTGDSQRIGTAYNQYSGNVTREQLVDLVETANTAKEDKDIDAMKAAAAAIDAAVSSLHINLPDDGNGAFLRIRCTDGMKRLLADVSTDTDTNGRLTLANTVESNSIFYLRDGKLLAYNNGLYLNDMVFAAADAEGSTVQLSGSETRVGSYTIQAGSRWLYGSAATLDSSDNLDQRDGYNWWLEEVTALPVNISDKKFATLWAPVALEIPAGVTAYTAEMEEEGMALTAIEDGIIPAETGVVLFAETAGSYSFNFASTAGTATTSALTGQAQTLPFDASTAQTNVYTLQPVTDESGEEMMGFKRYNGTKLSGFKARLETTATLSMVKFFFGGHATGIEGTLSADSTDAVIYDLSGRRVTAPAKGIYIVNGKKVIFK